MYYKLQNQYVIVQFSSAPVYLIWNQYFRVEAAVKETPKVLLDRILNGETTEEAAFEAVLASSNKASQARKVMFSRDELEQFRMLALQNWLDQYAPNNK